MYLAQIQMAPHSRGLEGVVANTTRLSDVIGDKGQLIYAGYDINELAGKVSYEEVVYLLWCHVGKRFSSRGEEALPNPSARASERRPEKQARAETKNIA